MYEEQTFDVIIKRLLEKVDSGLDKREGSVIYNAVAPAAAEIRDLYLSLDAVLNQFYISTATYNYLKLHGENYGLTPKTATAAEVIGKFTPNTIDVLDSTFSIDGINYVPTKLLDDEGDGASRYILKCQTVGDVGNLTTGTLIPVDEIKGLETAEIVGLSITGDDEESVDEFRSRLLEYIQIPAFGGNLTDYKQKVLALDGVGVVKIYPCTNANRETEGGHVLIEILDDDGNSPSAELIDYVYEELTGGGENGMGYGLAPIGHCVHVSSPRTVPVYIYISGHFGADDDTVANNTDAIKNAVNDYFASIRDEWLNDTDSTEVYSWAISTIKMLTAIDEACSLSSISLSHIELAENPNYTNAISLFSDGKIILTPSVSGIPILNEVKVEHFLVIG